ISGVNTINVGFTVTDIDHQTVKFTKSSIALDEGGSSQTFGVSLDKDPSGTVNVPITSDSAAVTVSPAAALQFNTGNYTTAQTITLAAPIDKNQISETANITSNLGGTGTVNASLTAQVTDHTQVLIGGWNGNLPGTRLETKATIHWYQIPSSMINTATTLD